MELNNIKFFANNVSALNKQAQKEETKSEERKEAEVRDNKPAEKQIAGEEVLSFMATRSVDVKVTKKVEKSQETEARIGGFMADFEAAYEEAAALGLSDEAIFAIFDKM